MDGQQQQTATTSSESASPPGELVFPSPFTFILHDPIPLVELRLRHFSSTIRGKPHWWEKVHDPAIVARWREEVVAHDRALVQEHWGGEKRFEPGSGEKEWPRDPVTDAELSWLFDELRYAAGERDEETGVSDTAIPMVYESTQLIPAHLKNEVRSLAAALEDVPAGQQDWHPGSDNHVLDLVHPSLYCLRIGHSYIRNTQAAQAAPIRRLTEEEYFCQRPDIARRAADVWQRRDPERLPFEFTVSRAYQWLPTDFAISKEGKVTPQGYINNLHPVKHAQAYATISAVLERFIPMFERMVVDELSPPPPRPFPGIDPEGWYDEEYNRMPADLNGAARDEWDKLNHWPLLPDALPFAPQDREARAPLRLCGRTLQVIVKMASIVLTPARPAYAGGAWHVEGMANERIVGTGIYYFDSANIGESRLAFRAAVGDGEYCGGTELDYEPWDDAGFCLTFGLANDGPLNQPLGHVRAEEDRCVVFPNVYQHRVAPFELADPARPGHRKILAFFLVDPLTRVHSTSDVPPQQAEWYREGVYASSAFARLPTELVEVILGYALEGTISLEEAKRDREELMQERAQFIVTHNQDVFEAEFAMCEH